MLAGIKLEEISELPAELTGRKRTSSISSVTSETPQPSKPGRRSSSGKDAESLENATPIAKNRLLDLGRHDDSPMTVSSTRKSRKLSLPTVDEDAMETSERQPVLSTKELEEITFSSDNDEEDKDISSRKKTRKSILPARNDLNTIDEDETELGKPEAMDIEEDKGTNASPRKSPRKVFEHIDSEVETKGSPKSPKSPKKELLQKHIEDVKKTPEKTGEDKTPKKVTDGKKTPEKTLCLNKEMAPLVCVNKIDATDVSPSLVLDRVSNKSQSPVKSATPVQNKRKSKGQEESTVELTPSSDSKKMTRNSKGHDEIPMNKTPNDSNPRTRKSSDNETNDTPKDTRKKSLENKSNTSAESKRKSKGSEQESQLEGLNEKSSEIDSNAGEEIVSVGNRKRKSKEPIVEREETPKRKSMGKASRNSSMVEEDEDKPVSIEEITVDDDDTDEEVDIIEQDMAKEKPSGKRKSRDTKDVSEGKQAQDQATPELKKRKSEANLVGEQVEDEGLDENKDDETVDDNKIETKEETLGKLRLEKAKALLEKKRKLALKRKRRKLVLKKKLAQSNSNSEDGESKQQPKAVEQKGLDKSEKKKDVSTHNVALTDKSNNDLSAEEQERKRLERILDKNRDRKEKWVKRLAEMKAVAAERKKEEKLEKKAANKILFDAIRAAEGQTAPEKRIKNRRRKGKKDKLHVSNSDGANKSDTPNINLSDIVAKLEAMTQPKGDVAGVLKERNEDVDEVARGKAKSGRWWKETKDK